MKKIVLAVAVVIATASAAPAQSGRGSGAYAGAGSNPSAYTLMRRQARMRSYCAFARQRYGFRYGCR